MDLYLVASVSPRDAAIEAIAYELARRNGDAPIDRGAALRLRLLELSEDGLARGFEELMRERGYRNEESGDELASRASELAMMRLEAA